MPNDSSTNRGAGVLCILLCMYGASMFAAVARIAESGSVELISESVIKGSLLLLWIICSMISFVRLFRLPTVVRSDYLFDHFEKTTAQRHFQANSLLGLIDYAQ